MLQYACIKVVCKVETRLHLQNHLNLGGKGKLSIVKKITHQKIERKDLVYRPNNCDDKPLKKVKNILGLKTITEII